MPEHQAVDPTAYKEQAEKSVHRKKVTYSDGTGNMFYAKGSRVDINSEYTRLNGGHPSEPQEFSGATYYAVGESGRRYYLNGTYDVMIVDPRRGDEPLKIHQLESQPPTEITVGEPLHIPGLGGNTEPMRAFAILMQDPYRDLSPLGEPEVDAAEHKDEPNPIMAFMPKFEEAHQMFVAAGRRSAT